MNSPSALSKSLSAPDEELTPYDVIKKDSIFLAKLFQGSTPISGFGTPFNYQETASQSLQVSTQH